MIIINKFCIIIIFILCLSVPSNIYGQTADDLIFMTENFPPYCFADNGQLHGIGVDLMVLMLENLGSKKTVKDITLLPWARAYATVLNTENTVLFTMSRTDTREDLFKWVGPVGSATIAIIARKNRNITIDSIDDITNYSIGVISQDIGEQLLLETGLNPDNIIIFSGTNKIDTLIRMMELGRFDIIAFAQRVFNWVILERSYSPDDFKSIYLLDEAESYFAFHKDTPDSLIQDFQEALDELKRDGTYQEIWNSYIPQRQSSILK